MPSQGTAARHHFDRVRAALAARPVAPDLTWRIDELGGNEAHVRGGRSIFRLTAPGGRDSVIFKVYETESMAAARFTALKALHARTGHVVRPRFLMPRFNTFAMDDAGDTTVLDRMGDGAERAGVAACAEWLGSYAQDVAEGDRAFDPSIIVTRTEQLTQNMATGHGTDAEAAVRLVVATFDRHAGRTIPHYQVFGDFKPSNLCVTAGGRLIAVDYLPAGIMPLERDLAFMLHWVRQKRWRAAIAKGGIPDPVDEARDRETALERLDRPIDENLLDAFLYLFLVRMWVRAIRLGSEPKLRDTAKHRLRL